ncbi:hypothetical protein JCM5296_005006 [Sporobolomyces johnsonii]
MSSSPGHGHSLTLRHPSPLAIPLLALIAPATLCAVLAWPVLVLGSFVPVVGLVSLSSLLGCTAFIYLALPTTLHLLFSQSEAPPSTSFLPLSLPYLPLFKPSPLAPIYLTHYTFRLLYDAYHSSLLSLFLDSCAKRILILGGLEAEKVVKENVVYLPSSDPLELSKRLDIYYPVAQPGSSGSLTPVVLLIPSPSYRLFGLKSFPAAQIALRLRRLGLCVVVPEITAFPKGNVESMVGEVREALRWIKDCVEWHGGDKGRVWVMGYGAGATISLLTVIQSAIVSTRDTYLRHRADEKRARQLREGQVSMDGSGAPFASAASPSKQPQSFRVRSYNTSFDSTASARSGNTDDSFDVDRFLANRDRNDPYSRPASAYCPPPPTPANSRVTEELEVSSGINACRVFTTSSGRQGALEPEERGECVANWGDMSIRGMILVGGTYDVVKQMRKEEKEGLREVSSLTRVCGPSHLDAILACPSHLVYAASPVLSSALASSSTAPPLPPNFLFLHGGRDAVVPYAQAVLLRNLLVGVGLPSEKCKLRLYREETHLGSLASLMRVTRYSPLVINEIERIIFNDLDDEPAPSREIK